MYTDLGPEERLHHWKEFRDTLVPTVSEEEYLQKVVDYWAMVPQVMHYFNDAEPNEWPTPWELIYEGNFCKSGLAFMMEKTLELAENPKWDESKLKLKLIKDLIEKDIYLVLVVDDEWVLNYEYKAVHNWKKVKKSCNIICEY